MSIPYKPLNDFIVVLADKALEATKNGIILTEALKSGAKTGRVVAVGPGRLNEKTGQRRPMSVKVGQRVAFGEFAGRSDLPVDPEYPRGPNYKILCDADILAVVEQTEEDYVGRIQEAMDVLGIGDKLDLSLEVLVKADSFSPLDLAEVLTEEFSKALHELLLADHVGPLVKPLHPVEPELV